MIQSIHSHKRGVMPDIKKNRKKKLKKNPLEFGNLTINS